MMYSLTRNWFSFNTDETEYLKCVAHFFTPEEAHYYEDLHNAADKDPDIYYEVMISATVERCDFCMMGIGAIVWEKAL